MDKQINSNKQKNLVIFFPLTVIPGRLVFPRVVTAPAIPLLAQGTFHVTIGFFVNHASATEQRVLAGSGERRFMREKGSLFWRRKNIKNIRIETAAFLGESNERRFMRNGVYFGGGGILRT